MTVRSLLNSLPARNMKRAAKEHNKLMIVIIILQILGIPMAGGALMFEMWLESRSEKDLYYQRMYLNYDAEPYAIIGMICFAAAVIIGMIAAASVFQEMWKKTKVDMLCSLPLTGKQRFFSHYLAGAWTYLMPYVIAAVLGWLVILIGSLAVDFDALESVTRGEFLAIVCPLYFYGTAGMFLLMTLYYTITVLLTICCGTYFETIYTTLLLNCLVPGTLAAVLLVITDSVYALDFGYLWQVIGFTSPIGGLIYLVYLISYQLDGAYYYGSISGTESTQTGLLPAFSVWAAAIILLIAAALVVALMLYKRRKAEEVGKPFVYIGAYYLMLTLLTVLILCLITADAVGPALVFSAIVYFVMEVIRKRGFRRFWVSAISYACTVALTIGMFGLLVSTDVFGTVYRIPSSASVKSVEISLWADPSRAIMLEYTDREIIDAVRALHKELASDMKEDGSTTKDINDRIREGDYRVLAYGIEEEYYSDYMSYYYYTIDPEELDLNQKDIYYESYYDYTTDSWIYADEYNYAPTFHLSLTYTTHLNNTIHRSYECNIDQYERIMDIISGTELFAEASERWMAETLWNNLSVYDREIGVQRLTDKIQIELSYSDARQIVHADGEQALLDKIAAAYKADLLRMGNDTGDLYGQLCSEVPIWNNCTETIAILEDLGMRPFTVPEKFGVPDASYENFFENHYQDYNYEAQPLDVRIYAPGDYAAACENYRSYTSNGGTYVREDADFYETTYYCTEYTSLMDDSPDLYALLDAAEQYHKSNDECYAVVVNGTWYMLPAEDSALAEVFFE